MKPLYIFATVTLTLSACGGTSSTPITGSPSQASVGMLPAALVVSYDAGADEFTLTNGGASTTVPTIGGPAGSFVVYATVDTDILFATTTSGAGQVIVLYDDTQSMRGTLTRRLTQTSLPPSGSANYSAEYLSHVLIQSGGGWALDTLISGTATLSADFGSGSISGTVENRVLSGGGSFNNITLGSTQIDGNADFSGTATGGEFLGMPSTTSGGTYAGQIVGTNGTEIVGGVNLNHSDGVNNRIEVGGFFGGS